MENKRTESYVHNTSGAEMPDPKAKNHGDTEKQIRAAFAQGKESPQKKNDIIPESRGDLADRATKEIDDDLQEQIYQARNNGKPPNLNQKI